MHETYFKLAFIFVLVNNIKIAKIVNSFLFLETLDICEHNGFVYSSFIR